MHQVRNAASFWYSSQEQQQQQEQEQEQTHTTQQMLDINSFKKIIAHFYKKCSSY